MAFALPPHISLPRAPAEIALSDRPLRKKSRCDRDNPYPFDVHLPESFEFSSMKPWIDELPIDQARDEIVAVVRDADVTIITSDTGAAVCLGRSTAQGRTVSDCRHSAETCCSHSNCSTSRGRTWRRAQLLASRIRRLRCQGRRRVTLCLE